MHRFKFSDIGEGLHTGTVAEVYKKVGDKVEEGDSLFSVETDKMTSDIPSPAAGVITEVLLDVGKVIHVGDVVYVIDTGGKAPTADTGATPAPAAKAEAPKEQPKPTPVAPSAPVVSAPVSADAVAYNGPVEKEYDLIVIGAGPAGYLCAEEASKLGMKTLIVEKEFWGGVCLNIGCIPTKALLNSTSHLHVVKDAEKLGVVFKSKPADVDFKKSWTAIQDKKDAVVSKIVGGVKMLLKAAKVDAIEAVANFVGSKEIEVQGKVYRGKNVVLATGSVSRRLTLPGFEAGYKSGLVITSRHAIHMRDYPKHLIIIGAGVIGIEMAQVYASAGVKVTVVQNTNEILNPKVAVVIKNAIVKKFKENYGVEFIFNADIKELKNDKLHIEVDGKPMQLQADKILVSIGRKTVTLGAQNYGVQLDERGVIKVDSTYQSSIPGLYAIGDVNAINMLAHAAYGQAQELVRTLTNHQQIIAKKSVPAAIYTSPEIAMVGLSEADAKAQGFTVLPAKFSYGHLGRAIATGKEEGLIEIYVNKENGAILGCQIFGANASDFISEITMAIDNELTIFEIASTIHPHPSYSEIIWEAARGAVLKLESK